uniref:Uncharacterized protein n=1 Tax=Romanomermis culicivorax TaxID=13658 RepID=A0A915L8L6_ROMCU
MTILIATVVGFIVARTSRFDDFRRFNVRALSFRPFFLLFLKHQTIQEHNGFELHEKLVVKSSMMTSGSPRKMKHSVTAVSLFLTPYELSILVFGFKTKDRKSGTAYQFIGTRE